MAEIPPDVERLVRERDEMRRARDFAAADDIRQRVRELGFEIEDGPAGPKLVATAPSTAPPRLSPADVPSLLGDVPSAEASIHWLVQGWPEDVLRGIEAFRRHAGGRTVQHVVVDAAGTDPAIWPDGVDLVPLDRDQGWAAGRNAGLRRTAGRFVLVADGSVEPIGDVLTPLERTLEDPTVGLAGPFGVVTQDLHRFDASDGPEVDAIEGYLVAFRRDLLLDLASAGPFDPRFRFYRAADIELSFRVKDRGLRCVVVPLPLHRHEHRTWTNTPDDERDRLSKRNFYRFLDRWRGRLDLCVAHAERRGADQ